MSELSRELYCGLANDHVVKEPISLSCGHSVCKQCVPDQLKIKCKICSEKTDKCKLEISTESSPIKRMKLSDLSGLFEELEKRATNEINSFKSLLENRESTLDAHLKYLEEEIEIRIESIKINLDKLFETFKKDLGEMKKQIIEIQNDLLEGRANTNELENNLKELRGYIKNNEAKTEEKFYEHQEKFKIINKMIKTFQDAFYSCKLDFQQSEDQVDKKLIGKIVFEGFTAHKLNKMKRVLFNRKIDKIELPSNAVLSLIPLPNSNIVCGTYQKVFLLNENFQEIKNVETGGDSFCVLNDRNEIYVSDDRSHCIILFDLNLNQIKQFGSVGAENNQLKYPFGLCCYSEHLYICDRWNKRIQILTLDFDYVNTIQLDGDDYPIRVQISNTTIGVSCLKATLFYDLVSKALKYKHNIPGTFTINYIDSIFCALNVKQKKMFFFDLDGNFLEEKAFHEKLILSNRMESGSMCRYKDQLYMIDYESEKVYKFWE